MSSGVTSIRHLSARVLWNDWWAILLAAALFVPVGLLTQYSPIAMAVCLASGCAALLFLMDPLKATMAFIVLKAVTDAFWFVKIDLGGFDLSLQRITGVLFPCLGLVAILLYALKGRKYRLPLTSLLLLFSLYVVGSVAYSPLPKEALPDVLKLVGSFVFYYLGCLYFQNVQRLHRFARLYTLIALFPFLTVVLQQVGVIDLLAWGVPQSQESWMGGVAVKRYAGIYSDAATTSIFLLVGLSLSFALVAETQHTLLKRFYLLLSACYIYALYVSSFRIVWAAVLVQILLWFFTARSKRIFLALFSLSGLLVMWNADQISRTLDLYVLFRPEGLSGKMGYWIILARVFDSADWVTQLFGNGFMANAFILRNIREATIGGQTYNYDEGWGGKAHSDIVEYTTDLGILGLAGYLAILWCLGRKMWALKERARDPYVRLMVRGWLCIFSTYLLYSMIGNASRYPAMTWPIWFLAGGFLRRGGMDSDETS
jgi:hypothetical protein